MESFANKMGVDLDEIISVGDSFFDYTFLMESGLGIAYNASLELIERIRNGPENGVVVVDDLKEILRYINQ